MKILTLASTKGGVGKSTLTGHLAAEAARHSAGPVAIVDCDRQGSLAEWWNSREADIRRLPHDLGTVSVVVERCRKAHKPHVMVLNAATTRSRIALEAMEVSNGMAPALKTIIHHRQLFASSMIDGRIAGEVESRSPAAQEITALWQEIRAHLRTHRKEYAYGDEESGIPQQRLARPQGRGVPGPRGNAPVRER